MAKGLDFGQPPAGGAGAETPAPAKGADVGPTPAHPALAAGSPETPSLAPLSRALDYGPAGADAGAGAPDSEGTNPPITPPRPPVRGRERDSDGTPSSAQAPPRKRREGPGPPPAAKQGLSFQVPAASAAAGSAASELPATGSESGKWTGYSTDVRIAWRVPGNTKGVEAAAAAVKHYIRQFAMGHDEGSIVDIREDGYGITFKIGGIREGPGGQAADARIKRQIHNCLS